jgi:hypothetical protein
VPHSVLSRSCLRWWAVAPALVAGLVAAWAAAGAPAAAHAATRHTPTYRLTSYTKVGQDRSFKCDIAVDLHAPPQLVVLGGSRATRFRPSFIHDTTGLTALNAAVQNFRPEDGWAISHFLYRRAPRVQLHVLFAVEATSFSDAPLAAGLLYDRRLSRWFPDRLITRQRRLLGRPVHPNILRVKRYSSRGLLLWNGYDQRRRDGVPLATILEKYIRYQLPKARDTDPVKQARSRLYFEKTIALYDRHGVIPVVVIMPYHPKVLEAFRAVGWEVKVDRLRAYLADLQTRRDLRVVDLLDIATFGGDPHGFYDGAHLTAANCDRVVRYVATAAPECFAETPSP